MLDNQNYLLKKYNIDLFESIVIKITDYIAKSISNFIIKDLKFNDSIKSLNFDLHTEMKRFNNKYKDFLIDFIPEKSHYKNVYVISDLHGDLNVLFDMLIDIGCVNITNDNNITNFIWNSSCTDTCIVLAGDIIDGYRCKDIIYKNQTNNFIDNSFLMLDILFILKKQANQYDSDIILLFGNHEIHNLIYYIDKDVAKRDQMQNGNIEPYRYNIKNSYNVIEQHDYIRRLNELKKLIVSNFSSVVLINDFIISHSVITEETILYILSEFNIDIKKFELFMKPIDKINFLNICNIILLNYYIETVEEKTFTNKKCQQFCNNIYRFHTGNFNKTAFYRRTYFTDQQYDPEIHTNINDELHNRMEYLKQQFKMKGIIIGHNITINNQILTTVVNDTTIYNIDTGLSKGFPSEIFFNNYGHYYLHIDQYNNVEIIDFLKTKAQQLQHNENQYIVDSLNNNYISVKVNHENMIDINKSITFIKNDYFIGYKIEVNNNIFKKLQSNITLQMLYNSNIDSNKKYFGKCNLKSFYKPIYSFYDDNINQKVIIKNIKCLTTPIIVDNADKKVLLLTNKIFIIGKNNDNDYIFYDATFDIFIKLINLKYKIFVQVNNYNVNKIYNNNWTYLIYRTFKETIQDIRNNDLYTIATNGVLSKLYIDKSYKTTIKCKYYIKNKNTVINDINHRKIFLNTKIL